MAGNYCSAMNPAASTLVNARPEDLNNKTLREVFQFGFDCPNRRRFSDFPMLCKLLVEHKFGYYLDEVAKESRLEPYRGQVLALLSLIENTQWTFFEIQKANDFFAQQAGWGYSVLRVNNNVTLARALAYGLGLHYWDGSLRFGF